MFPTFTAFFTAIAEACKSLTTFKKRQSETDVIKTKKKKSKAVEIGEQIIFFIEDRYPEILEDKDYKKLKKKFFRYN